MIPKRSKQLLFSCFFIWVAVHTAIAEDLIRTLAVNDTHLLVPVSNVDNRKAVKFTRVGLYKEDQRLQNFNVRLAAGDEPFWWAAYPLYPFVDTEDNLTIKIEEPGDYAESIEEAFSRIHVGPEPDYRSEELNEPYRNQFHFAPMRGWNNDPNGLVWHDGRYHMFYQFNPLGTHWENMHWGHVTSTDLIHWKFEPVALFQRTVEDMAFSGGGFVDTLNSAGMGAGTLWLAFTSTGRGECLAYSQDGIRFEEIPENPVVVHDGRDPKVIWYEPENKWVMVVFSKDPNPVTNSIQTLPGKRQRRHQHSHMAFYESTNLRNWSQTGVFTDPDRLALRECPELFPLFLDGDPRQEKWILYGASNRYFIGHFDGKAFHKESGPHGRKDPYFYAAQIFSNDPGGQRIQVGWIRTENYRNRYPAQVTNQAMSLPQQLRLVSTEDGPRLRRQPVDACKTLRKATLGTSRSLNTEQAADQLQVCKGRVTEVVISFAESGDHVLQINGMAVAFSGTRAHIFTDRTFSEAFIDEGRDYSVSLLPEDQFDEKLCSLKTSASEIESLEIYELSSIW